MTAFAYCLDCHEVTTGVLDQAKGFLLGKETNHIDCAIEPFGDVAAAPRPIFNVIARLGASVPITDTAITLFRLALDLHDYPTGSPEASCPQPPSTAPDAASTSPTMPAAALASAASTRSQRASTPTSATPVREADLLDLLEGAS